MENLKIYCFRCNSTDFEDLKNKGIALSYRRVNDFSKVQGRNVDGKLYIDKLDHSSIQNLWLTKYVIKDKPQTMRNIDSASHVLWVDV